MMVNTGHLNDSILSLLVTHSTSTPAGSGLPVTFAPGTVQRRLKLLVVKSLLLPCDDLQC
jgi:hypothetical protein